MAKEKVENKTEKFKRVASLRTQKILNDLRLIGNCSNKAIYSYSHDDINKIFGVVDKEFKRVKMLFNKPKNNVFSL